MKKIVLVVLAALSTLQVMAQKAEKEKFLPTVLVEFYTSEGCSSCPVADEFSQEIRAIADSARLRVFTLDYHVDLWDKSGWVDPFSDSVYTERQLMMALKNNQKAMFTPMVFVNGKGALPGSAKNETGKLIEQFTRNPAENFLLLNASWFANNKTILFEYDIKGKTDSLDIYVVLAQKEAVNVVTAGENAGKTLSHHNVVRKLVSSSKVTQQGSITMVLADPSIDFTQYRIFGFLQHRRTGQIMASQILEFKQQ